MLNYDADGRLTGMSTATGSTQVPGATAATAIRRLLDSAGVAYEQTVVDAPLDAYVLITTETLDIYTYVDGEIQIETRGGGCDRLELADFSSPAELLKNALLHVDDQIKARTKIARRLDFLRSGWLASYLMVSALAIVLQVFDPWTSLSGIGTLWVVALLFSRSLRRGRTSGAHAQR